VASGASTLGGIHVSGTRLVDGKGNTVILHGLDRSGTEYACIQGWGIFDGPNLLNDDAQVPLMKAWGANEVLIGLNEDCWLGINGVPPAYGGENYIKAIVHETNDHSPAFWHSVAETFKGDPNVILRLKEEPFPDDNTDTTAAWKCWSKGDVQYGTASLTPISNVPHCTGLGYPAVGMQSLVNIVRGAGAKNVIELPGVEFSTTLYSPSTTMTSPPTAEDPANDLALGLFGAYYYNEDYTAPAGWNMTAFNGDSDCAGAAVEWSQLKSAASVKGTITSSGAEPYLAGVLVLHP
jgi:endoglucanase